MSAEKRKSGFKTKNYIAAMEWAAFDFPRLSLTRTSFSVIPAALSPKISETSGRGTSPRLISIGAMEDDASVRARIGSYWAAVPHAYADGECCVSGGGFRGSLARVHDRPLRRALLCDVF